MVTLKAARAGATSSSSTPPPRVRYCLPFLETSSFPYFRPLKTTQATPSLASDAVMTSTLMTSYEVVVRAPTSVAAGSKKGANARQYSIVIYTAASPISPAQRT